MSIQGDVVKGSQTRSVCLSYFPIRAGHFALQDNTTKMKAEIGTHAPTALRSRDALGQQQHRTKTWATGDTMGHRETQGDTKGHRDTMEQGDTKGHRGHKRHSRHKGTQRDTGDKADTRRHIG